MLTNENNAIDLFFELEKTCTPTYLGIDEQLGLQGLRLGVRRMRLVNVLS